jgi:hypothetical protein
MCCLETKIHPKFCFEKWKQLKNTFICTVERTMASRKQWHYAQEATRSGPHGPRPENRVTPCWAMEVLHWSSYQFDCLVHWIQTRARSILRRPAQTNEVGPCSYVCIAAIFDRTGRGRKSLARRRLGRSLEVHMLPMLRME